MPARTSTPRGPARLSAFAPGLTRLRSYDRAWLRGDLLAGVTVAAYLIPQVMAYARVAGLPSVTGLWAATGSLLVYAVLGSSRQLSVGPEASTALMTATAVAAVTVGHPERHAAMAAALALAVGGLCVLGWAGRLGFLGDLLSRPVLVGYMSGIAVIMITSQLGSVTGYAVPGGTFASELAYFVSHLRLAHWPTVVLAAVVLAVLLLVTRLQPRAPAPLIGMLVATAAVWLLGLREVGVKVVGTIPSGLPTPQLPTVSAGDVATLLLPAIGVAIVGYSDNVLTARAFATRNRYEIDGNQELLALGGANVAAGLMQGFPVSSSSSRTVIGDALGSRSQLYSLVALVSVLATVLFLRPVLAAFPMAALGALVVYAALRLIDVREFRRMARFRTSELVLALATTAAVLVFGVLYGVLAAIGLSILDLLRRVARPHDGILGYVPGVPGMHDIDDYPNAVLVPGLVVYRYDSPLFFANADDFRHRALAAVESSPTPVEWFLLNAESNIEVDITAGDALEELRAELESRGIVFAMARVKQDLRGHLAGSAFLAKVGEDRIFPTLPTAVHAYTLWYADRHGEPPPGVVVPEPPTMPTD